MKKHYSSKTEIKRGQHLSIKTEIKKGEHLSKKTEFKKGFIPWNKGKTWSLKIRKKMSEVRKNRHFPQTSKTMKKLWNNAKYRENQVKLIMKSLKIYPNKPERIMGKILNKLFPKYFKYVGSGSFRIEGKCPDFVDKKNYRIIWRLLA